MQPPLPGNALHAAALIHELEVYQDELGSQNRQLLEMQRAIEQAAERYAELYQFAPIALLTLDDQACILEMNLGAAALLGVPATSCKRYPLRMFVAEAYRRRFLDHVRQCRAKEGNFVTELEFVTRKRVRFRGEMTTRSTESSSGEPELRCVIVDLTERLEAEEAGRRADEERRVAVLREEAAHAATEAKDRFIAMLSHELRTPLMPILATASDLELTLESPVELRAALARIRRNVEMEVRLIDDLLDVSRIERKKLRLDLGPVNVEEVIRDVVDGFREQVQAKRVALEVEHDIEQNWLNADRTRLHQVVANLVRNALQSTPSGGRISVTLENPDRNKLRVSVEDTGAGIDPRRLQRIFSPFQQEVDDGKRAGGLGLGLSICRGIIEAHGGTIEVSSDGQNRGARFTFELEALADEQLASVKASDRNQPATAQADTPVSPTGARNVTRVLIVEDHLDSAETLAEVLERRGYRTRVASSIEAALAEAERGFELLISDIGLPDGSGHELMQKLRARGPVTAAIALSGYGSERDVAESHRAGFSEHLTKPVDVRALLKAIERACAANDGAPS